MCTTVIRELFIRILRQETTTPYFSICGIGPFKSQAGTQEKGTKYVNAK